MMRVFFGVVKAFLCYFLLNFLRGISWYFIPKLEEPGFFYYISTVLILVATGYFISKVAFEHAKKTALIFGVLLLILQYHEMWKMNFAMISSSFLLLWVDIVFTIPYIFAGVYLRYFILSKKIYVKD
jgi:hypothetical protein